METMKTAKTMNSANANKNANKLAVIEKPEIIVRNTIAGPYFEIKYHEVGKSGVDVGFGSYDIENVLKWRENEFVVVEAEERKTPDVVREPQHYQHGTFEVIDEMLLVFGPQKTYDFCILNAWKYRSRAPYKGNTEQDMEKADRYMQMAKQIMDNNLDVIHEVGLIKCGRAEGESDGSGK